LVDLPPNCSIISAKWLFCRKYNLDGSLACFVACSFFQQAVLDYSEMFLPILKMTSLCLLLALAILYDYHIHQMDVIMAFLNGVLKEEIYILFGNGKRLAAYSSHFTALSRHHTCGMIYLILFL